MFSDLAGSARRCRKVPDGQVVVAGPVCDLQLVHHSQDDDAIGVHMRQALLTKVVDSRRTVMCDRCQQLRGVGTKIDNDFAIEKFSVDTF